MLTVKNTIDDLNDFEAWAGGKVTKNIICERGLGKKFISIISARFPDGIDEGTLNDILWFKRQECFDILSINAKDVATPTSTTDQSHE